MTDNPYDSSKFLDITASASRDAGKTFRIHEVNPMAMAAFGLRLLAALRLSHHDDLTALFQAKTLADGESRDLNGVLRVLTGCDPQAVSALLYDALAYVEVAADPRHPTAFRKLAENDIREMATLGDILGAFVRVNLLYG